MLPTLPGKADGIVGWNPIVLQCRRCGRTRTSTSTTENETPNLAVILSGSRFHTCPGGEWEGSRLCPACLADVLTACPMPHLGARLGDDSEWVDPPTTYRCLACGLRETCAACQAASRGDLDEFGTPPLFDFKGES